MKSYRKFHEYYNGLCVTRNERAGAGGQEILIRRVRKPGKLLDQGSDTVDETDLINGCFSGMRREFLKKPEGRGPALAA
jgi:hypothetical protein